MTALNYMALQQNAKNLLINTFGGVSIVLRYSSTNGNTLNTYAVFKKGTSQDIDNRQNATVLSGLVDQLCYVPGDLQWVPNVGDQIEYYVGTTKTIQRISKVDMINPTSTPLLYILTVE